MKKNNKIIITVIIAVVFAIAAGICAYMLLSPQRTTMYVFNGSYRAGTVLKDDMLIPVQADANIVLAGAKTNADNYFVTQKSKDTIVASGDSLKTDVTEGMALMRSMLSATGGNSIEMSMSPSKIAVTVNINDITGITNELSVGSSVNVYIMGGGSGTYLLFENMRLLEVFKDKNGSLTAATLELTNDQVIKLLNATSTGAVYLGLVNGGGYQYVNTPDTQKVTIPEDTEAIVDTTTIETEATEKTSETETATASVEETAAVTAETEVTTAAAGN